MDYSFKEIGEKIDFKMESVPIKAKSRKLRKIRWIQIRIPCGVTKSDNVKYYYTKFWGGRNQDKVKQYLEKKLGKENVKWIRVELKLEPVQDIVAMHNIDLNPSNFSEFADLLNREFDI